MRIFNVPNRLLKYFNTINFFKRYKDKLEQGSYYFTSSKSVMKLSSIEKKNKPELKNLLNINNFFSIIYNNELHIQANTDIDKQNIKKNKYNKLVIKDRGDSWLMYFSSSEDHILHVMSERVDFEYKLSEQIRIPPIFNTPQIIDTGFDNEKYYIKEEYLHQDDEEIDERVILDLLDIYSNYYRSNKIENSYFQFQHGDLFRENLIQKNKELYFIDWDWQGFYPFYYDILFLIIYEHLFNNSELLTDFMNGKFDNGFLKLAESCGQVYCSSNRNEYIYNVLAFRQKVRKDNVKQFKNLQDSFLLNS